ncbi:MAG: hypothetical protein MK052_10645 [Alphaproteobacteria bacterium]|nr:hypothetical protein [Alphaproteobacteria bacterium]
MVSNPITWLYAILHANADVKEAAIKLPQNRYAHQADIVLMAKGDLQQCTEYLQEQPEILIASYVPLARCINVTFEKAFVVKSCEVIQLPPPVNIYASNASHDALLNNIRYAYYRAEIISQSLESCITSAAYSERLAIALLWLHDKFMQSEDEAVFAKNLMHFFAPFEQWYAQLVIAKTHLQRQQNNGDLMQKESIQGQISSALLARAAASTLHHAQLAFNTKPIKDWAI